MELKEIWQSTSIYKNKIKKEEEQKEQEELRKEVLEEIKPELKQVMKDRIKQEEIEKIKNPPKKKNILSTLVEEFKSSNIGSSEQMDKLLGKNKNNDNSSILSKSNNQNFGEMLGSEKLNTNKNFGEMMGSKHNFDRNNKNIIGLENKQEEISNKIGGFVKRKK